MDLELIYVENLHTGLTKRCTRQARYGRRGLGRRILLERLPVNSALARHSLVCPDRDAKGSAIELSQEEVMRGQSPQVFYAVGIAAIFAAGCRSPQEPAAERAAELLGARVPAVLTPGTGLRLVAYFGRGACEAPEPVVALAPTGASIGMRLRQLPIPAGSACPDVLLRDSVVVSVAPPVTLPYTVRLQRATLPDSVVIVRASEPAG